GAGTDCRLGGGSAAASDFRSLGRRSCLLPAVGRVEDDVTTAAGGASRPTVRVLCATRYYVPGYLAGGPIRSVSNLANAIGNEFDLRIVCLDRDLGQSNSYGQVVPRVWTRVGQASVLYVGPDDVTVRMWYRLLRDLEPDVLYTNSLFDVGFSIVPVLCATMSRVPTVIAPRGELSGG